MNNEAPEPKAAELVLNGWSGVTRSPITVIGETPKKYRISVNKRTKLAGRYRWLRPGETALVPKHAVMFIQEQT